MLDLQGHFQDRLMIGRKNLTHSEFKNVYDMEDMIEVLNDHDDDEI